MLPHSRCIQCPASAPTLKGAGGGVGGGGGGGGRGGAVALSLSPGLLKEKCRAIQSPPLCEAGASTVIKKKISDEPEMGECCVIFPFPLPASQKDGRAAGQAVSAASYL